MIKFNPKKESEKGVFIIKVVGDSNDADYITEFTIVNKEDFDEKFIEEIKILDKIEGVSYALENLDEVYDYYINLPYGENGVCHTLSEITVEYIDSKSVIYNVEVE